MKILFLEPFFGGSHKDFALGFQAHSRHDVDLVSMPARFWKWRMRGAAIHFLSQINHLDQYDAIFCTDMFDLTDFKGLCQQPVPPVLVYFHENQLDYPLSPGEKRDFHMGFTNIISAAAADRVMFNSRYHFESFVRSAEQLMEKLPDYIPFHLLDQIKEKTEISYPGCRFEPGNFDVTKKGSDPPMILWNHRWEHDKNPEDFYDLLTWLKNENLDFSLAILGENFSDHPPAFQRIKNDFSQCIKVFGFAASKADYFSWLEKADVVISCATQENFGISVVEAVRYGCLPVLPARLSYPELIAEPFHAQFIYHSKQDCREKIKALMVHPHQFADIRQILSDKMERFSWDIRVKQYDNALKKLQKSP